MLELQKEMETLKKKSNEELNVLREENAKLRRKIKTTEKVGTEKKDPSHSNEHTWKSSQMSRLNASTHKYETCSRQHPFTEDIMETKLSANWKGATLDRYDGSTDPDEHIDVYVIQIRLYMSDDAIFCTVFPTSLNRTTLNWFTQLSANSIDYFDTLVATVCYWRTSSSKPYHLG